MGICVGDEAVEGRGLYQVTIGIQADGGKLDQYARTHGEDLCRNSGREKGNPQTSDADQPQ